MRRLFGWLAGLVGIAALARLLLARREQLPPGPTTTPVEPDLAAELRRKLSETRAEPSATPDPGAPGPGAPQPGAPQPGADEQRESLDDRRARVHAKAIQAIDEMKEPEA